MTVKRSEEPVVYGYVRARFYGMSAWMGLVRVGEERWKDIKPDGVMCPRAGMCPERSVGGADN